MEFDRADAAKGELPEAFRPHFQGAARFQQLTSPFPEGPNVFFVHFEAGGRTRPHVHHTGQVLHIVAGEGVVADGSGRHVVGPGDVVTVMPDEWHWHGGSPSSPMSHLTVQFGGDDVSWDVDEGDWASGYGAG
ncbi:MAG TPA: AraC family ligand binding domain-containing protein [Acidimicrobiales bacterium]|nr:AraC family ligand binding domain-containing protein [Acidimicrobiales bacterium]